jgi:dipeptidase D
MNNTEKAAIIQSNRALAERLAPRPVFEFFADIAAIPRGSGDTGAVADYLAGFAAARGLAYERDALNNVIIRKEAQGAGNGEGVILQAHQDMVCVKKAGSAHDFRQDPIALTRQGDWLHADGTTLGADDGIGIALALAVLDGNDIIRPPLEALFTVDEETDMKGVKAVQASSLRGSTLINLDAEDLDSAFVSSAAGVSAVLSLPLQRRAAPRPGASGWRVRVRGLAGGHSGIEIQQARANAYVLLARFLAAAARECDLDLHDIAQGHGGGADNAIPDRCAAALTLHDASDGARLAALAEEWTDVFRNEYRNSDPAIRIELEAADLPETPPMDAPSRDRLLTALRLLPLGVFRFIQTKELATAAYGGLLVETSCNLGIVSAGGHEAELLLLTRGSTASVLEDLMERIQALADLTGGALTEKNRNAGWAMPAEPGPVQRLFQNQGMRLLGIHAGLECGCLVQAFARDGRRLDAVSVGPDLKDVHSPNERLNIPSVGVLWRRLLAVLAALAVRDG